jgi:DNA-damage-inducible protein D
VGKLNAREYRCFEDIRHVRSDGGEYWLARELAPVLDYAQWRNFARVVDKAMIACRNSGYAVDDHFADVSKMVGIGSGTDRGVADCELSRYACYLIVQNGDPRKDVIALGQTYFAIQTRRQEVADYFNQLDEDNTNLRSNDRKLVFYRGAHCVGAPGADRTPDAGGANLFVFPGPL